MKRNITLILITLCLAIESFLAVKILIRRILPFVSPISGLVLEVNGTDYVATLCCRRMVC